MTEDNDEDDKPVYPNHQYIKLEPHVGHKLTVANYGNGEELSVECLTCNTVLYSEPETEELDDCECKET